MLPLLTVGGDGWMTAEGFRCRAAIGRGGFALGKREGDGCTPVGTFPLRACYYRSDRAAAPVTGLPCIAIEKALGWCDDPGEAGQYNRPVRLPFPGSHERMWREDAIYDYVIVIGHNDDPPVPGLGSAIFLHLAHEDFRPTEGCVAIARTDMVRLLPLLGRESHITLFPKK